MREWMRAQSETFRFTRALWGERSNFGPVRGGMYLAELVWTTSEALYQALKGLDPKAQVRIAGAATPREAKRIGRSITMRSDWEEVKVEAMAPRTSCEVQVRTLRPRDQPCEEPRGTHRRRIGARCVVGRKARGARPARRRKRPGVPAGGTARLNRAGGCRPCVPAGSVRGAPVGMEIEQRLIQM